MSVDPAGGSTARIATEISPPPISSPGRNRTPRRAAIRPATTPPPAASAASHRATVTTPTGMCTEGTFQGGPCAGMVSLGGDQYPGLSETAIITRIEPAIPATAAAVMRRVPTGLLI